MHELLAIVERRQELMSGALEECSRKDISGDIRDLDERISAEEMGLLEKKQAMKELLKERRSTEVEEWREIQLLLRVGSLRRQRMGLKALKRR